MLQRHRRLALEDRTYVYALFVRRSNRLVGLIDIAVLIRSDRQLANLGWQLGNRHWGRGYAREATRAALTIAFTHLRLHRLEAAINLGNERSLRLARAIGMRDEGVTRNFLFENGGWVDHHIFAMTPEDLGIAASPPLGARGL